MATLGPEYFSKYEQLLADLARPDVLDGRTSYAAMWPMRGSQYEPGGTMVIGRAVNSWDDTEWRLRDAVTASGRRRIVNRARAKSEPAQGCPFIWLSARWGPSHYDYNAKRSAFWRTVQAVCVPSADPDDRCWPSKLCWSNLYKVAPQDGGNPSSKARGAQDASAACLLASELAAFEPRRVLVLAGRSWFEPFARRLDLDVEWGRGSLVEGTVTAGGRRWVIAAHPQGKNEGALVARVRSAFGLKAVGRAAKAA